jgi:hypothetical protein
MKSHEHPICPPQPAMESSLEKKAPEFSLTNTPAPKAPAPPPATTTAPAPATPATTSATPAAPAAATPVVNIPDIARRVHKAIDGMGTDEAAVHKALGELGKARTKLKRLYPNVGS